jgi:superfamily I DNA and/or RNA helicase
MVFKGARRRLSLSVLSAATRRVKSASWVKSDVSMVSSDAVFGAIVLILRLSYHLRIVAMTRPKRSLVVIGDSDTVKR